MAFVMMLNASLPIWPVPVAAAAVILAALACYWFRGRDHHLKAVDIDRIPDGLSALEIGTVLDSIVQGENLGVQLLDWAQRGYITLRMTSDDCYVRRTQTPKGMQDYEKKAWEILFADGVEIVSLKDRKNMIGSAKQLQEGAEMLFESGEKRMTDALSSRFALAVWCIGALCLLAAGALVGLKLGFNLYGIAPIAIACALPAVMVSWLSGWYQRFYQLRTRKRNYLVITTILLGDLVMALAMSWVLLQISGLDMWILMPLVCAGIFCAVLAPFVGRRSNYGYQLLCELMGLRDALDDAACQPGRLEDETDDMYILRMLPYAHVMGEGHDFVQRYEGKTLVSPGWLIWEKEETLTASNMLQWLVSIRDQLVDGRDDEEPEEEN